MLKKKIFFGLATLTTYGAGYYCYTEHKKYREIIDTRNSRNIYENVPSFLRNSIYVDMIYDKISYPYYYRKDKKKIKSFWNLFFYLYYYNNNRKDKIKSFWNWFFEENDFRKIPEENKTEEMCKFALTHYPVCDIPAKYWSSLSNEPDFNMNANHDTPEKIKEFLLKNGIKLNNFNITGLEMTGHEFNQLYPNVQLRKQISSDLNMKNFQYKIGQNTDTNKFKTDCQCCPGGLYFSTKDHIREFLEFGPDRYKITIPDDEKVKVYIESKEKAKASSLIIKKMNIVDKFIELLKYHFN